MSSIATRKPLIVKVSSWFLKLAIFGLLLFFIYEQGFSGKRESWQSFSQQLNFMGMLWFLPALILVFLNWGLEVRKWMILIRPLTAVSTVEAWHQVLTGVTAGFITPNRLGEHVGRILPLPSKDRARGMMINVRGSFAQVTVTLLAGLFALVLLQFGPMKTLASEFLWPVILVSMVLLLLCLTIYFKWELAVAFLPGFVKRLWLKVTNGSEEKEAVISPSALWKVMGLSGLRYAVYLIQYVFVCLALGFEFSTFLPISIALIFLFQTLSPGMALIDLGIRGNLALWLLGPFVVNPILPLSAALGLWMINLAIPAFIGSLWQFQSSPAKT